MFYDLNADGYIDAVDYNDDGYIDYASPAAYTPDYGYGTDYSGGEFGYGYSSVPGYSYSADDIGAGYSPYDTSFIEPAGAAGASSLISSNDMSSVL